MSNAATLRLTPKQWSIVLLIAAVQFVNILDFVIVMPMGPEFAKALGISEASLGYVNGSYTGAACVAGFLGSFFLDRFDRRKALAVALLGLVAGTAAGGFAVDLSTLLLARAIAGTFGGPATSLAFSIISDAIPAQVRGRAMGTVMGAFSVAAVVGVPAGLWMAEHFGWRAPFFSVAGLGLVIGVVSLWLLPPMRGHLDAAPGPSVGLASLVSRPLVQLSYAMTAVVMFAGFVIIPNIAAYLQLNLGVPREHLKYAYLLGGLASLVTTQVGGRLVDRFGSARVGAVGAALVVSVVYAFFYLPWDAAPSWVVLLAFVGFMVANGLRNVSYTTLASKVPEPEVRARFQSLQSAVQHGSSAVAAVMSAQLLSKVARPAAPGREPFALAGMDRVALLSISLSLIIPLMLRAVERGLSARQRVPLAGASGGRS